MSLLFALRLFGYRLLKPLGWPVSRAVAIPRPTLFVGPDASLRLCASIGQFGYRRVMIVTDAVLVKLGLVEPLRQALLAQGIDVAVHDGITPDPTYPVLQAGYEAVRAHRSDAILAVGGGSAIDAAKVIGAMTVSGKSPAKLVGMLKVGKPMLPLFAIPTTAGTGSEVTVAAVVTDPVKHVKSAIIDSKLMPACRGARSTAITAAEVYTALAAFQTTLVSLNSRYDRYAHGYAAALNERELAGLNVFRSFVARCAECHTPPLFTNGQVAVIGAPEPAGHPFDAGAEKTFHAAKLRGGFKVPTLRNIARTAPYMHSGAFGTLRETVEFYNKGRGNAVPPGETLYLHWHISSPDLTATEVGLLVDFLQTLTDEAFTPEIPQRVPSGLPPLDNPKESRT